MNADEVRTLVATHLVEKYPPLLLTFYNESAHQRGNYVVIGNDYGTELCVHLSDGRVYSIDPNGILPTRFVNGSISQLVDFIRIYSSTFEGKKSSCDGPTGREVFDELQQLDPLALNDPD